MRPIRHFVTRFALSLGLLALAGLVSPPSYAKKSALTPAKVKQAKRLAKSYEKCRRDALADLKAKPSGKNRLESALAACKENFPGASLYVACKKSAIRTAKAKGLGEAEAAGQCKRYLTATAFAPTEPVPFFTEAGQLFFAGIGMNRPQPESSLAPPNFDCAGVKEAAKDPKAAQYILFGNHPRAFEGLGTSPGSELMKALGMSKTSAKGLTTKEFGKVYGDPREADAVAYFPVAACDFEAEPGELFTGLSAYYLMDRGSGSVTPYFGIVYFSADQTKVATTRLVKGALAFLGQGYKPHEKNKLVTFLAQAPIAESDDEGDPKNLCKQPRAHHFVAIVQARRGQPSKPEYLAVVNVKNLCEFGDRLSKQLTD